MVMPGAFQHLQLGRNTVESGRAAPAGSAGLPAIPAGVNTGSPRADAGPPEMPRLQRLFAPACLARHSAAEILVPPLQSSNCAVAIPVRPTGSAG